MMRPKINPNIEFDIKKQAFAFKDKSEKGATFRPIDPLAFFICSLCNGQRTLEDVSAGVGQKLRDNGLPPPENLTELVGKALNVLSQQGIVFLEE